MDPQDLKAIAEGRQPRPWSETFTHPVHGPLTFRATLPKAMALAEQSVQMDNLLQNLAGEARMNTLILCSAISGLKTLIELPVLREEREEDPDSGHIVVKQYRYDPENETDETFLANVWMAYSQWRASFMSIGAERELKNSSGETDGDDSSESSSEASASPSTIPA
jgi:hypothetical protein